MLEKKYIKPIPKTIRAQILDLDTWVCPEQQFTRFYAYLTSMNNELVQVTVAVKNGKRKIRSIKQIVIRGVYSDNVLVRDVDYYYGCGYVVSWKTEGYARHNSERTDGKWYSVEYKYFKLSARVINPQYALRFAEFKYSCLDRYPAINAIEYLRKYSKYPTVEYFVKNGLENYIGSKAILAKAQKEKAFRKWLIQNRKTLTDEFFYVKVILRAYKRGTSPETEQRTEITYHELKNKCPEAFLAEYKSEILKLSDYLVEQDSSVSSYVDYYNACVYLGMDLSLPKNRYPHDFMRWHDIRIDEYHTALALAREREREEYLRKFAEVATKYLPLEFEGKTGLMVIIPRSVSDLVHEGEILNHCVGRMNYDQKMAREETLIFFVRNKAEVDKPFVTVEYSLKTHQVLQCYGYHDTKPDDKVLSFVRNKWLPFANKQVKQIQAA